MTQVLDNISTIASNYDAIVLDQWGVLHDGSKAYTGAVDCLVGLAINGIPLAVLSNSGKRSALNAARIAGMGFAPSLFTAVMTSGEALWRDTETRFITERRFFPIERSPGDAKNWAEGLDIKFEDTVKAAQAILLMGLPDGNDAAQWQDILDQAFEARLPIYCSNPDRSSPRSAGRLVTSPGALAHAYRKRGGKVVFYGKPHRPIFDGLKSQLKAERLLMVGDSLEHDIAGGHAAGWDTLLIRSGLYAADFDQGSHDAVLARLVAEKNYETPTYSIERLK
ncbi:TIGR01459 family HAD-type hydrolase [Sulfitobacter sp. SK012]|uniref:TIGR01459 family HAD-type hydrolase n=1 Tax=Sulfitobacter sp. SK012 TaxID=1389005 RepID=UPI000E0B6C3B|nr:TIGR01459 family HAD-type hydrolase [Sulfitobacter sp. SK012]AXI45795.1 TIGR01459 family HAD-type hydrolase [Sulfitobacter sp. SK012]